MAGELIGGRYRLLEPLGRGAMSAVWRAEDDELGRQVAVKLLAPSAERERFEREARAAASLAHPNIVQVYDYGESADGRPFMVLELLPGGSLEDRLRDGARLTDEETRRVALELASGLAHAHEHGLVHRDLKPANVLFDGEDRARIADFGIARMHGTGTLTDAGTVLGTASYISPEQAAGSPAGPPSDVYSFGVILFRMLTGALPFVSANAMELVRLHRDAPPPAVTDRRADVPAGLAALTAAALAKDPDARPADGAALLQLLRGDDEQTAETRVVTPPPQPRRGRNPVLAAGVLAALLAAGGAVAAIALTRGHGPGGTTSTPGLTLPSVSSEGSTSTAPTTTAAPPPTTTTAPTTTAATTPTTTTRPRTTTPATTTAAPTTTALPPTTTVAPPPTTTVAPTTTTAPPTTTVDTTPTTPTTTAATTTVP